MERDPSQGRPAGRRPWAGQDSAALRRPRWRGCQKRGCQSGFHGNRGAADGCHRPGYQAGYHRFDQYAGPVRTLVRRELPQVEPSPFGKKGADFAERGRPVSKLPHQPRPAPALGLRAVGRQFIGGVSELFPRTFPRSSDTPHPLGLIATLFVRGRSARLQVAPQVAGCHHKKRAGCRAGASSLASREKRGPLRPFKHHRFRGSFREKQGCSKQQSLL